MGWMYVWFGDFIYFIIGAPLLMCGFHSINFSICHARKDRRQYQFFLVVIGTAVLGTITQDWFWWISAPDPPWGPGVIIYYYFDYWIQVPFTELYIPVLYFIVALVALAILYIASVKIYSIKEYLKWCVCPYLLLILIGNILFFAF